MLFTKSDSFAGLHDLVLSSIEATIALENSGAIDVSLAESVRNDVTDAAAASSAARSDTYAAAPAVHHQPSRPVGSLREALLGRVVLSGGSSRINGLPQRLAHELGNAVETDYFEAVKGRNGISLSKECVRVRPSIDGDATTWLGAAMLAGTSTFAEHWCVHAPSGAPRPFGGGDDESDEKSEEENDDNDDDHDHDDDDDDNDNDKNVNAPHGSEDSTDGGDENAT